MQADPEEGDNPETGGPHLEIHDSLAVRTVCTHAEAGASSGTAVLILSCRVSLQRVLGLASLDGVLNPAHVSGKHIVHNVFNVNKSGIVLLENKAGVRSLGCCAVPG